MTVRPLPVPARFSFVYIPPSVEGVAELLRTGRAGMALRVLEQLPSRIEADRQAVLREAEAAHRVALAAAHAHATELQREVERLNRELGRLRMEVGTKVATLSKALDDGRVTVERVADLLKVRPADVLPIVEGRVGLSPTAWQRVLAEIAA